MSDNKLGYLTHQLGHMALNSFTHNIPVQTPDGLMVIHVGLCYLRGNKSSYWSITASGRGFGGCCHEEILKARPDLAPFVELHLCNYDGMPSHAAGNGAYVVENYFTQRYGKAKGFDQGAKELVNALNERGVSEELRKQLVAEMDTSVPVIVPEDLGGVYDHFMSKEKANALLTAIHSTLLLSQGKEVDPASPGVGQAIKAAVTEYYAANTAFYKNKATKAYALLKQLTEEPASVVVRTAFDWLKDNNVEMKKWVPCPDDRTAEEKKDWPNHAKYTVRISRNGESFEYPVFANGLTDVTALDIMCREALDGANLGTYAEFCRELGMDEDSRRAERMYNGLKEFSAVVHKHFSTAELTELQGLCEDTANMRG